MAANLAGGGAAAAAAAASKAKRVVVWLRNDLRLHDNYVLHEAVQRVRSKEAAEVLPLYIYDPRTYGISPWGTLKTGTYRWGLSWRTSPEQTV